MPFGFIKENPFLANIGNNIGSGLDAAVGNVATDPSLRNVVSLARDIGIESLPGDQKVAIDNPYGGQEGLIKKAHKVSQGDLVGAGAHFHTAKRASRAREALAEKGLGASVRKAGSVLAQKVPAIAAKIGAGSAASAGILAPAMAVWGVGDLADTAVELTTGKSILGHAQDPAYIRGRSGAKRGVAY